MQNTVKQYIAELNRLYRAGNATEHSYRPALQRLLESMIAPLQVTNEPRRIDCGAPDFIVTNADVPVGYIEAKDVCTDLNSKTHKAQFDRYRQSLGNLIITDYLTFILYRQGIPSAQVTIGAVSDDNIIMFPDDNAAFTNIIQSFVQYRGDVIFSTDALSKIMASKARLMAAIIEKSLSCFENSGINSIYNQLAGFRQILIPSIKDKEFADVYAQTIAYGMFAAKLNCPENVKFSRSYAATLIPHSNPFLRNLFNFIAGFELDGRISWIVDELADMFNRVDIEAIKREFNSESRDPFIHFYENFLAQYDAKLRKKRGVWYTPHSVVSFIVRAVDDTLKHEFAINEGLADKSKVKIGQNVRQPDGSMKEEQKDYHRVQILDPAAGTGTFLAEVVQNIYSRFTSMKGAWQSYASDHLIPRINGFEILMASYAMAHLKIDMLLQQTGYKHSGDERLRIFLTNSLDEARANTEIPFAQWLGDEANAASRVKRDVPVMVVLGNPPYRVSSQNKSKWIKDLTSIYKQGMNERNIQPLSDDYIKFIRYGQFFVEKNGAGILAYISNNSFLDGIIHRQMRKELLAAFDKIYILDLHGSAKKAETTADGDADENVFDIQQGVSINIFIKSPATPTHNNSLATVFHYDLYGKRPDKYNFLDNNSLQSVKWEKIDLVAPQYFFVPKDFTLLAQYEKGFKIDDLFAIQSMGVTTADDVNLVNFLPFPKNNQPYNYRPFDTRNINYDLKKVQRHRYNLMQHFLKGKNIGLCFVKVSRDYNVSVFVTDKITDKTILSSKDNANVFPLYCYPEDEKLYKDVNRKPNLNVDIIKQFTALTALQFTAEPDPENLPSQTFAPIHILDYIYAILHHPVYRERYREFLKIDFPRVPFPKDAANFWQYVSLGAKLRRLHLMENVQPIKDVATFPAEGNNMIEKIDYPAGADRVKINNTQYFENVPRLAWDFYTGGYQPAQKWLKDRKGRTLNFDDINHYRKIVTILIETGNIMTEINNVQIVYT